VSQPGAHGTVYIEAAVNTEGDITTTKVLTNTTGSDLLANRNAEALQQARFYPIVQKGQKKDFLYYYRVDY
jgi:outer membrane biosynthesis protein TonB